MTLTEHLAQLRAEREAERLAQEAEEQAKFKAEIEQRIKETRQCLEQMLGDDFELVKPHLHDETFDDGTEEHFPALRLDYNKKSVWFYTSPEPNWRDKGKMALKYHTGRERMVIRDANEFWNVLLDL